jgi:hypothetical protein
MRTLSGLLFQFLSQNKTRYLSLDSPPQNSLPYLPITIFKTVLFKTFPVLPLAAWLK